MNHLRSSLLALLSASFLLASPVARAASGTWILNPVDSSWNTPANWSSNIVPTGFDTATFGTSNTTDIAISEGNSAFALTFNSGASAYSFTALPGHSLDVGSGGITNSSGMEQNFIAQTDSTGQAGTFGFTGFAAGSAGAEVMFTLQGASLSGAFGGAVYFSGDGGNAGSATLHALGGTVAGAIGGFIDFSGRSNAAESAITIEGGQVSGASGGWTLFENGNPSAVNATIVAAGSVVSGGGGGLISFYSGAQAANSTLIANGGVNGGAGGTIEFRAGALGVAARVEVFGNGTLDFRLRNAQPPMTIGSLEGDGVVFLNSHSLSIGGNGLSTTFSGLAQGSGSLAKIGTGVLTLSGASVYTAGTTVSAGTLVVANTSGSATGTGAVSVAAGTFLLSREL